MTTQMTTSKHEKRRRGYYIAATAIALLLCALVTHSAYSEEGSSTSSSGAGTQGSEENTGANSDNNSTNSTIGSTPNSTPGSGQSSAAGGQASTNSPPIILYELRNNEDISIRHKRLLRTIEGKAETRIRYPIGAQTKTARELAALDKNIDVIWYYDAARDEVHFFTNILGGAGEDFTLQQGAYYSISVRNDTNLTIS